MSNSAVDYGRRCQSIGSERRVPKTLDDAMRHTDFKMRHHQLLDKLAKEYQASLPIADREPWMTIQHGTHRSKDDLRKVLEKSAHSIGDLCHDIFEKIDVIAEPAEVDLIVLSNAELGFPDGCTVAETYEAAQELGLELCLAEVGPQLRLQYKDQPMNEWVLVAMDPITDRHGLLRVFSVGRGKDGSWLGLYYGSPDTHHLGHFLWVFVRRK